MDFVFNLIAFFGYFGGSVAFCLAFGAMYEKMTPQREFYLIVHEHKEASGADVLEQHHLRPGRRGPLMLRPRRHDAALTRP